MRKIDINISLSRKRMDLVIDENTVPASATAALTLVRSTDPSSSNSALSDATNTNLAPLTAEQLAKCESPPGYDSDESDIIAEISDLSGDEEQLPTLTPIHVTSARPQVSDEHSLDPKALALNRKRRASKRKRDGKTAAQLRKATEKRQGAKLAPNNCLRSKAKGLAEQAKLLKLLNSATVKRRIDRGTSMDKISFWATRCGQEIVDLTCRMFRGPRRMYHRRIAQGINQKRIAVANKLLILTTPGSSSRGHCKVPGAAKHRAEPEIRSQASLDQNDPAR
jgi:hypothetical protein